MSPNTNIRILQLIDSLEAGGAERMAVNYANALHRQFGFSALVTTRSEGALKYSLATNVVYQFLNRKRILDIKALFLFRKFIVQNQVTHVHAHSSSVFLGVLLKLIYPKVVLIWHDHYGKSEMLAHRPVVALRIASFFVSGIIAVNQKLKQWSESKLCCEKVVYLPNFTSTSSDVNVATTRLYGVDGKRIVCLANLRPQKHHKMLLQVATQIKITNPDWTFHLIGKDFEDSYSKELKDEIQLLHLTDTVFIYGSRTDIPSILSQSNIGILTSLSEGLPIAILEYGFYSLPVIATSVGEVPAVISDEEGVLVGSNQVEAFCDVLKEYIANPVLREMYAVRLHDKVMRNYSEAAVLSLYLKWINEK